MADSLLGNNCSTICRHGFVEITGHIASSFVGVSSRLVLFHGPFLATDLTVLPPVVLSISPTTA